MKCQIHLKYSECQENINKLFDFLLPTDTENLGVLKMLRAEYERRAKLKPLSWLNTMQLPLKNVYTRLKIISRRKADFQVENEELGMYHIFQALGESEDVKMTLAEGSPGTGKTTFCLKLAYDWARGEMPTNCSFPKFEFVLLLKCRDINGDLMEAIKEQLLPEDIKEETWTKLSDFITDIDNQERILIILDGLDELPKKSRPCVHKLLKRKILPFCYVLATSRQETGIEVRKNCEFDLLLEIKGFTDQDSFQYIRKHFQNIGPEHTSKGESLIVEIRENDLLNALRNNPLNLILLCVVYEDYKGKLPTARTELYQVVVQCLLRRYCAKHSLKAPGENSALEKQFEETILALGELAWLCLLSERHGFRESELAAVEIRYKGLLARDIGLLYKEESLKRLNPQHEYYFLHKTFQEYLAAAFVAHKLRGNELRLFERLSFHELVKKYREVFLFVSGVLGRDASILFTQIGEELKNWGEWGWVTCEQSGVVTMDDPEGEETWDDWDIDDEDLGWVAATFFTKSFSESGHAEKMAETLCSYIPFPPHVMIELSDEKIGNMFHVLDACKTFSNLQKPVRLTVHDSHTQRIRNQTVAEYIQSCLQLQTLGIVISAMTSDLANALYNGLSGNMTLSEFTLGLCGIIPYDAAVVIGELLATQKSLKNVKFTLVLMQGEAWASAIETGLSADTLLSSVALHFRGSMSDTAVLGLGKLSSNKALTKFSLNIDGDMQDSVAAVISDGIAQQTALKTFSLKIDGKLSSFGANNLKRGLLENRSLNNLKVTVLGKVPSNWQSFAENIRLAKKVSVTLSVYPDSCSRITHNQLAYFCPGPAVVDKGLQTKRHLTVILWGELSADGAGALCEVLVRAPLTSVNLRVHGKLNNSVANCIARYFSRRKTVFSLTIDVWGKLAPETVTFLQGLSGNNAVVEVKVRDVCVVPDELCKSLDFSIDNIASLTPALYRIKNIREEKVTLKIINDDVTCKEWTHLLGNALAENTTITALDLTINNYVINVSSDLGKELGESLLKSSSVKILNLVINNLNNIAEGWECSLLNSLAKLASLTTLTLAIDNRGNMKTIGEKSLGDSLMAMKSLSTLSVVISANGSDVDEFWSYFFRTCLEKNTSLALLCVTVNNYYDNEKELVNGSPCFYLNPEDGYRYYPEDWYEGLANGLAITTSLNELTLTINHVNLTNDSWVQRVCEGLAENKSVTTLTVTVNGVSRFPYWVHSLIVGLAKNTSVTTLGLNLNDYSEGDEGDEDSFLEGEMDSPKNTTLTTVKLTINMYEEISQDWLPKLCDLFENSSSLTALRLEVNNHCASHKSRLYDFSRLRLKCKSLSLFDLTVTFYGE